ncbi:hypothetical protein CEP53_010024, partial [Fusarium sp. AF-6]
MSENEEEPLSGKYDLIIVANAEANVNTSNLVQHLERPGWLLKARRKSAKQPTDVEIICSEELEDENGQKLIFEVHHLKATANSSAVSDEFAVASIQSASSCFASPKTFPFDRGMSEVEQ